MANHITVVGIDSFDTGGIYENPPRPFLNHPPSAPRTSLLSNYAFPLPRHVDVRKTDNDPNAKRRYKYFTHGLSEKYQFLLLAARPVFDEPFDGTGLAMAPLGYLANRRMALDRYNQWFDVRTQTPALAPVCPLEVIYYCGDLPLVAPILARRVNPTDPTEQRYRLNITPVGAPQHLYRQPASVLSRRYAYLPPGTPSNPTPFPYQHGGIPFATTLAQGQGAPKQLYAVGCTCLDYAFRGYGGLSKSAHGCKHMIFWNLCRKREDANGVPLITWPAGVP